jgi:hypothetical protein
VADVPVEQVEVVLVAEQVVAAVVPEAVAEVVPEAVAADSQCLPVALL